LEIGSGYVKNSMSVLDATNYTDMYEGGETTEAELKLIKLSIIYMYDIRNCGQIEQQISYLIRKNSNVYICM